MATTLNPFTTPQATTPLFTTTPSPTTTAMLTTVNPFFTTTPPRPPCNWTLDTLGVARPVNCTLVTYKRYLKNAPLDIYVNSTRTVCRPALSAEFDESDCVPPAEISPCALPNIHQGMFKVEGVRLNHGAPRKISCADGWVPIDEQYNLSTWGEDHYPGAFTVNSMCNNGTWIDMDRSLDMGWIVPNNLFCAPKETVLKLKECIYYQNWTNYSVAKTEAMNFKWIDSGANLRMTYLKNAMAYTDKLYNATVHGYPPPTSNIQATIDIMLGNRMVPHGEPFTQETCKDLEKHFLWQLPNDAKLGFANYIPPINEEIGYPTSEDVKLEKPVPFTCSYSVWKTNTGYDPYTRKANYYYRDGCYCTSQWTQGCPFKLALQPNYKTFGFDAMDEKPVTTSLGASTNALCWYWSNALHPEWGYLRSPLGAAYQAPIKNSTQLAREFNALKEQVEKEYAEATKKKASAL